MWLVKAMVRCGVRSNQAVTLDGALPTEFDDIRTKLRSASSEPVIGRIVAAVLDVTKIDVPEDVVNLAEELNGLLPKACESSIKQAVAMKQVVDAINHSSSGEQLRALALVRVANTAECLSTLGGKAKDIYPTFTELWKTKLDAWQKENGAGDYAELHK